MSQVLSETLRKRRKAKGMTQEQLAEVVHVSRQTISNWETGRANPDYEVLKQLAEILDTTLTELLGVETEEQPEKMPEAAEAPEQEEAPVQENRSSPLLRRWLLLGAALLVLAAAVAACMVRPQAQSQHPLYPAEWFMEALPAEEGKAHLVISVLETPVQPMAADPETGYRWEYKVRVRETNGVGCTIDKLAEYTFWPDGNCSVQEKEGAFLQSSIFNNELSAKGVLTFVFADTSTIPIEGRGILLKATDRNGNQVTARYYVPYAQGAAEER